MKHDAQYYAAKAEECLEAAHLPQKGVIAADIKIANQAVAIAQAQVYATLAVAAAQDKMTSE